MASPTAAPSGEYAATLYGSSYWANLTVTATSTAASIVDNATNPPNPLLEFQPGFSRSLIIQLIVLAGVATLTFVLLLHLAFTTRYHYPLAKTNYFLLTSGCFLSFCAVIWQISEIAVDAWNRAREWPFMFDYLEFVFPGDSWSASKSAIWLTFNAVVVFLCHAAHIHVLTLLYPSKLEARFLLSLLLPLALIGVALSYSPLIDDQRQQDIFDSGSAVCNSTLTLLYTCALLFWGLYIARPRAWGKTDESGSTAVFGGCAIGMAMVGTALSFLGVRAGVEQAGGSQGWLARMTWLVLLWQTWFTVWWWIGAGMYSAERPLDDEDEMGASAKKTTVERFEGSVRRFVDGSLSTIRRRRRPAGESAPDEIEMASIDGAARTEHHMAAEFSSNSSSSATNTPPTFLASLLQRIRRAHVHAAKQAQRDILQSAQGNPNMNDAIQGRRGKGWSVSGIVKSRQDRVIGTVSAGAPAVGRREFDTTRDDRRVGAVRLDQPIDQSGEWEDLEEERQNYASSRDTGQDVHFAEAENTQARRTAGIEGLSPSTGKRWQSWRRKDITRYD